MRKEQWVLRQVKKFGRKHEVAEVAWVAYLGSRLVQRGNLGCVGSARLWLSKGEYSDKVHSKFIQGAAVQSSDSKKIQTQTCVAALQAHAHDMFNEAGTNMGDDFCLGKKALSASSSFLAATQASKSGQPQEAGSSEDEAHLGLGNDESEASPPAKQRTGVGAKRSAAVAA